MFPTDLHGDADNDNYIISLRSNGKANQQVNTIKKIVLSKMDLMSYRFVYSLGKNHMQELKLLDAFETEGESEKLRLPLPKGAVEYKELELVSSQQSGIHNLNHFRIINQHNISTKPVLAHVHKTPLAWFLKNSNSIDYLIR